MFGGYIKVKNFVPRLPHYNTMAKSKKKKKKGQRTIYKALHRKQKIVQHQSPLKWSMNSGVPKG